MEDDEIDEIESMTEIEIMKEMGDMAEEVEYRDLEFSEAERWLRLKDELYKKKFKKFEIFILYNNT